ncbi:MAG: hypothetical protein WCF28_09280 [Methanobacterium sp.]|uniref:hypothetical protein n=1 Tax=Methanobacterium sp. TaxID=2164 RepID=UPI003C78B1C6
MEDRIFEEIEEVFNNNFEENVQLINQSNAISAEFEYESDAKWFYLNICHPDNLKKEEYPVNFISSITPIGDLNYTSTTHYTIKFEVKDKNKLIDMINTKRN